MISPSTGLLVQCSIVPAPGLGALGGAFWRPHGAGTWERYLHLAWAALSLVRIGARLSLTSSSHSRDTDFISPKSQFPLAPVPGTGIWAHLSLSRSLHHQVFLQDANRLFQKPSSKLTQVIKKQSQEVINEYVSRREVLEDTDLSI